MSNDNITRLIKMDLDRCNAEIAKFTKDFAFNPASALEWSTDTFAAAALRQVLTKVQAWLSEDGADALKVLEYAQNEVTKRALRGSKATDECRNLMRDEITAAWARVVEIMQISSRQETATATERSVAALIDKIAEHEGFPHKAYGR